MNGTNVSVKQFSTILDRAKHETRLLEAVLNVTTLVDQHLILLSAQTASAATVETYWPSAVARIRAEYRRLRRKKGRVA